MADLDDFFAKKDRKKSKNVKKFATPEELAKSFEDAAAKKIADSKIRKVTPINPEGNEQKKPEQVEEEWKEFEEERKDYSGLKLAQLTISEQEGGNSIGEEGSASMGENDGEGGEADNGAGRSGAWRNIDSSDPAEKLQQQQQRAGSSVYVSPAMKNLRLKSKKGVAPDLKNEEFFPTLGAEQPVDPARNKKDSTFEEVKHGGRIRASDLPSAQPLQVGNRFTSLSNDAS